MAFASSKKSVKQNRGIKFFPSVAMIIFLILAYSQNSNPAIIEIYPLNADSSCNEEFENKANALNPGDELVLHGGIYTQSCRRAITVNGTASSSIIIRAATGETPILTRPGNANFDYPQNNIEIEKSSCLVIGGLQLKGRDIGVWFLRANHHTINTAS